MSVSTVHGTVSHHHPHMSVMSSHHIGGHLLMVAHHRGVMCSMMLPGMCHRAGLAVCACCFRLS
jgi:hypothetical protein